MLNNDEIKSQIQILIDEYALKLADGQRKLSETTEDLRILRKSYQLLEEKVTPNEKSNLELSQKCHGYERKLIELEEQLADLNSMSAEQTQQVAKLKHHGKNQLITIIILIIALVVAIAVAALETGGVKSIQKSFSTSTSSTPSKVKAKRHRKVASDSSLSDQSTTADSTGTTADSTGSTQKSDASN